MKCWGENSEGELGIDDTTNVGDTGGLDASIPFVSLGAPAIAIYAGHLNTCAVLQTGALKCWGFNYYGNLGLGDDAGRGTGDGGALSTVPTVDLGADAGAITSVSLGGWSTCALRADRTAKCWGASRDGVVGLGDTAARGGAPNQMGDALPALPFPDITSISVNLTCTCIVTEGRVKCWGNNDHGQLGLGDRVTRGDKPGYHLVLPFVDLGD